MPNRMDRDRELKLIIRANGNDSYAFEELLNAHMPFIHKLAGRLQTSSNLHEELTQAGCIGFMMALRRYNPEINTRLITYAVPWITGEMKRTLRNCEPHSVKFVSFESLDPYSEGLIQRPQTIPDSFSDALDLKASFDELNETEQKILMLRYFRGMTQKETALILNKSQAQISKSERRILDALRSHLE